MGYCMSQTGSKFCIAQENQATALAAVLELCNHPEKMQGGSWSGGLNGSKTAAWFSWVDMDKLKVAENLSAALHCWRWDCEQDEAGNIVEIEFSGEKLGQDQLLFDAIAPWVRFGSYIEMSGEDDTAWRWVFEAGKCREVQATITWEE